MRKSLKELVPLALVPVFMAACAQSPYDIAGQKYAESLKAADQAAADAQRDNLVDTRIGNSFDTCEGISTVRPDQLRDPRVHALAA